VLLTPQGVTFSQEIAQRLAQEEDIILICGHYEGVDERLRGLVDEEISLGDFVLTGGEIAAMALTDCVARLVEGVLGDQDSLREESFAWGLLEYPQFTRPRSFLGRDVPEVLLSGNHRAIANWRYRQSICRTFCRRPDMLRNIEWGDKEREAVDKFLLGEAAGEETVL
jgi:tRNA (guanine37-N1)-methyltransferase